MVEIKDSEQIIMNGQEAEVYRFERTIFLAVNLLTYSENVRESKIGHIIHKLRGLKEIPNIKKLDVFEKLLDNLDSKQEPEENSVLLLYEKDPGNDRIQKNTLYLGMRVNSEESEERYKVIPFIEIVKNYPRKNSLRYKLINASSSVVVNRQALGDCLMSVL